MKRILTILGVILLLLMLGSWAFAVPQWYLGGYGKYNLSWGKFNEAIRGFNSWTQNLGLTDFEMKEFDEEITLYSLGNRWIFSPQWEIELNTTIFNPETISESKEKTIPLEGGGSKWLEAEGDIRYFMTLLDLVGQYRFVRSSSKLTPFIEAGFTYYTGSISGNYWASEEVYTPPWNYEYRNLSQDFSVFDSQLGYVLGGRHRWFFGKALQDWSGLKISLGT